MRGGEGTGGKIPNDVGCGNHKGYGDSCERAWVPMEDNYQLYQRCNQNGCVLCKERQTSLM